MEAVIDAEEDPETPQLNREPPEYVEVIDPFASEIAFLKSDCPSRKVIKVVCDQLGESPCLISYRYSK